MYVTRTVWGIIAFEKLSNTGAGESIMMLAL
jgi:hypothetical protein